MRLVAALRSPQTPSRSLPFPARQRHVKTYSNGVGAWSRIGTHVSSAGSRIADRTAQVPFLATITFLGERQDIFNPVKWRCLFPGRRRSAHVLSASSRSTACLVTPKRSPTGASSDPGSTGTRRGFNRHSLHEMVKGHVAARMRVARSKAVASSLAYLSRSRSGSRASLCGTASMAARIATAMTSESKSARSSPSD